MKNLIKQLGQIISPIHRDKYLELCFYINIGKGWDTHLWMKIPKDYATPDWLSIEPSVDGSFNVMTDSMVKEMLSIVVSRLPNYDEHKLKYFNQKEPHTLIHGDLHQGNHLCGTGANEGKVIAVDFQLFGKGLICVELVYLMTANPRLIKSYDEYEEFLRGIRFLQNTNPLSTL